jgi:hypothetical protein
MKGLARDFRGLLAVLCVAALNLYGQLEVYPITALPSGKVRENQIAANTEKLRVAITMDRQEYLPGEAAEITISIVNPTTDPLEVYEPFKNQTGTMWVDIQRTPGQQALGHQGEPLCCPHGRGTTRWFASGETAASTFQSGGDHFGARGPMVVIPEQPGGYRLYYLYGSAQPVNFTVIPATVALETYVALQRPGQYTIGTVTKVSQRRVPVAVVKSGDKYHVVASMNSGGGPVVRDGYGTALSGWARAIGPYVRVSTSDQPITSLNGTELVQSNTTATASGQQQAQESITVRWTTQDGKQSTMNLGPDRKPTQ